MLVVERMAGKSTAISVYTGFCGISCWGSVIIYLEFLNVYSLVKQFV